MGLVKWLEQKLHFWKFTIPTHMLALVGSVYAIWSGQGLYLAIATLIFWVLCSIGTEVGTHRLFSHRSFKTWRWVELVLMFLGTIAAQGTVIFWVAVHRGFHHPHADTDKDLHSPVAHGKWHAYAGWLLNYDMKMNYRAAVDLLRDPAQVWLYKHFYRLLLCFMVGLLLVGGPILLIGYLLGMVLCTQQNFMVNLLCHTPKLGYRTYETKCESRNISWLSIPTWGLSLHNNHHKNPGAASLSHASNEIDPSYWVIKLIEKPHA